MIYKIRAILDVKKDVIRDIIIDSSENLETLHATITSAFGFNGQEMASFYRTDIEWNQGEEIPLFDMSENEDSISMNQFTINETFINKNDKLIYVYDFMSLWTFFIELSEIKIESNKEKTSPKVVFAFGDVPETAPEKEFKADRPLDDFGFDGDSDGFLEFDNIDDYDI